MVAEGLRAARAGGLRTSFDINHRARLWSDERAAAALREVLPLCDIVFASAHDLRLVTGHTEEPSLALAQRLRDRYGVDTVVLRGTTALTGGRLQVAVTVVGTDTVTSEPAEAEVVDPFGAGDVAAAAFLAARLGAEDAGTAANLAARACAHKYTVPGDSWIHRRGDLTTSRAEGRLTLR